MQEKQTVAPRAGRRGTVYSMAMVGVMAAVISVVAPWGIPIEPVPLSLCTFAIYLSVFVLDWRQSATATLVYVLLGSMGVPVFSGFVGGLSKVMGPTGGYIIGYVPMALVAGIIVCRFPKSRIMQLAGLVLGTAVLYALGTAWFCFQAGQSLGAALGLCVIPFIPGDMVKIVVALGVGPVIRSRLEKAGVYAKA